MYIGSSRQTEVHNQSAQCLALIPNSSSRPCVQYSEESEHCEYSPKLFPEIVKDKGKGHDYEGHICS